MYKKLFSALSAIAFLSVSSVVITAESKAAHVSAYKAKAAGSRILAKKDFILRGKPSCKIDFIYVGHKAEDLFWEGETCKEVSARMVDRAFLEKYRKWDRLDSFARKHVLGMPGGKVLYVEGQFTASIYPIGTTRQSYEIAVAD